MSWQIAHVKSTAAPLSPDLVRLRSDGDVVVTVPSLRQINVEPDGGRVITLYDRPGRRIAIRAAQADDHPSDILRARIDSKSKSGLVACICCRAALSGLGLICRKSKGKAPPPSFAGVRKAVISLRSDGPSLLIIKFGEGDEDEVIDADPIDADETAGEARPRFGGDRGGDGDGDE